MSEPRTRLRSVHVVGASGALRDTVVRTLGEDDVFVHDAVDGLLARVAGSAEASGGGAGSSGPPKGDRPLSLVLLLADSVSAGDALGLLRDLADDRTPSIVALVQDAADGVELRTLSLGWSRSLGDVAAWVAGEGDAPLELRHVVGRVARARHDINNPLTSALAQTQLLLLEHGEGEAGEDLRDIETQIKRIADLVASTSSIRPRTG